MDDGWREITADWIGESAFIGRNITNGSVQMGTFEGKPGISPMELLLAGLAGCTGEDVVSILLKKRQPVESMRIVVRGKRADTFPKVYNEIEVLYMIWGNNVNHEAVEQAIKLSKEKYCSASAMLSGVAEIRSSYKILVPGMEE